MRTARGEPRAFSIPEGALGRMRKIPALPLNEIRDLYRGRDVTVAEIARRAGIGIPSLVNLVRREGWGLRHPRRSEAGRLEAAPTDDARRRLVARIWAAADAQLAEIEARMRRCGEGGGPGERDARMTATLVKTVRELVALEDGLAGGKTKEDDDVAAVTPEALRAELVRRLEARLRKG